MLLGSLKITLYAADPDPTPILLPLFGDFLIDIHVFGKSKFSESLLSIQHNKKSNNYVDISDIIEIFDILDILYFFVWLVSILIVIRSYR